MASFDDIGSGSITNFGQLIGEVAINTFDRMVRGIAFEMISSNVNNFNLMNYDFMKFHMFRNAYEKEITLDTLGENAYTDGNPDITATPAQYPSYTKGNNYMEFITNTLEAEKSGMLTTRIQKAGEENTNLYLDFDNGKEQVKFTGSYLDRNSILYKTKKLIRQHKLKTIISEYHTNGVEYNGQVGSQYGESHGRNLLTKSADNGTPGYDKFGYENPYCRVWTHQNKYDKIGKTMRANGEDDGLSNQSKIFNELNYWPNFEWDNTDKGHKKNDGKYGDGEKYDYSWRGKHNQDRRKAHSALDYETGLVKVTPQYRGGTPESSKDDTKWNRHTKECMFSIENLAWKDYDPYSFEQALSWEQRGPLGGRIMWFPPYGITVSETASAKWNTNDFIGRGEPIYTYVSSERKGNLSFLMITDHPSSIDYASWWDDSGKGNSENDYLRYFAGCSDENSDGKTGGLIIKPTPMTDEYTRINPPLIEKQIIPTPVPEPPEPEPEIDNSPVYVEFFVYFPNNYSGVWDKPTNKDAAVNAIAYLLGGCNTMKQHQVDIEFDVISAEFAYENSVTIGYEMEKGPITTDLVYELDQFIQGGKINAKKYVPDPDKKWCYRIDHIQPYTGGNKDPKNTINQSIGKANLKDTKTNKTNLAVNPTMESHAQHKDSLYSFAEVAAAIYSEKILNQPLLYKYLVDCGVNLEKVNVLIDLFTNNNQKLTEILCEGAASSHGTKDRNNALSINRANTVLNWIRTNTKFNWNKLENTWDGTPKIIPVDAKDKKNINGDSAKMGRCAHCVMTFTSGITQPTTGEYYVKNIPEVEIVAERSERPDIVGFKFKESKPQANGQIWDYYVKDGSVEYYDQKAGSADNYDSPDKDDIVVNENQIFDIFDKIKPEKKQIIRNNPKYRGLYNVHGFYIGTFNYSKEDDPIINDFSYTESAWYYKDTYVYDDGKLYLVLVDFYCYVTTGGVPKTKEEIWQEYGSNFNEVSNLMVKYNEDDYILIKNGDDDIFYKCLCNYAETYDTHDIPFSDALNDGSWARATDVELNSYDYFFELAALVSKSAATLCFTVNEMRYRITGDAKASRYDEKYSCIWKYGTTYNLMDDINTSTDLVAKAEELQPISASSYIQPESEPTPPKIKFTKDEENYLESVLNQTNEERKKEGYPELTMGELRTYIILYRILDGITKINDDLGTRNVCETEAKDEDEMNERTTRVDESETEGCDNIWVDRGDGMLIQECNIPKDSESDTVKSRFNGEKEVNKLRYDQEYRFYKQWIADHPLMYEKLQDKIKYFNPAFHSMTPEGFNTRLTFLQQCTRQGNTKTMSDSGGRTASNLAFGRPPYCVLRLGDFYNQMIVINNITFDYDVDNGIQWDMNTEGNGIQPMLCKVSIDFTFIGGGDITGPVQRLQNAMSFNYYANASFYDNRADRVEYQPTNWKTMGGAGNHEIDMDKSYAYLAQNYEQLKPNEVIPG